MPSDHDAFLQTICEHPFDLRPRLVFADWLDENATGTNGFARQAEVIRLQCDGQVKMVPLMMLIELEPFLGCMPHQTRRSAGKGYCEVEPKPQGGPGANQPTAPSRSFCYRNRFVEEIRCPLAWWLGGEECECVSRWELHRVPPGEVIDGHGCYACHGTGHIPANGPTVVTQHPVTRVVCSDREPKPNSVEAGSVEWWGWYVVGELAEREAYDLPVALWEDLRRQRQSVVWDRDRASRWCQFPTREAAVETLSRVLVSWARNRAGLTPIQWEVIQQ